MELCTSNLRRQLRDGHIRKDKMALLIEFHLQKYWPNSSFINSNKFKAPLKSDQKFISLLRIKAAKINETDSMLSRLLDPSNSSVKYQANRHSSSICPIVHKSDEKRSRLQLNSLLNSNCFLTDNWLQLNSNNCNFNTKGCTFNFLMPT